MWTDAGRDRVVELVNYASITLGMALGFMLVGAVVEAYFAPMALKWAGELLG